MMDPLDLLAVKVGEIRRAPGNEIHFNCPFCATRSRHQTADRKLHCYLNTTRRVFYCHRCDTGGKLGYLFSFLGLPTVMRATVQEWDWPKLVRKLVQRADDPLLDDYDAEEPIDYPCEVATPVPGSSAWAYLTGPKGEPFRDTGLTCRGLSPDDIEHYRIAAGTDRYRSRVFIPITKVPRGTDAEVVTFWVARDFSGRAKIKYLSAPGRSRRYHIGHLDQVRATSPAVVITEGCFSGIAAHPIGVWTFGKHVTADQVAALLQADFELYYVALDGDALPQSLHLAEQLYTRGKQVALVRFADGEDPDSVLDLQARIDAAQPYDGFESVLRAWLE